MKLRTLIKTFAYSIHTPKIVIADEDEKPLFTSDSNSIYCDLFIKEQAGLQTPLDAKVVKIEFISIKFIMIIVKE